MSTTSILGKVTAFFFFSGFVLGKAQNLPIPGIPSILNLISLFFYLLGYGTWFVSSHFHPNHAYHAKEWYGFAQFKEQHLFAATLGILATSVSIAAFFVPVLLIPAAWLFLASNSMWSISEYHKLQNPNPADESYSHSYQKAYFSYSMTMTSISTVTALSLTAIAIFPALTLPIFILSAITILGLTAVVAEVWLNYMFGDHKPTPVKPDSSLQMAQSLGAAATLEESPAPDPEPYQGQSLLKSVETVPAPSPEVDNPALSNQQTCSMSC